MLPDGPPNPDYSYSALNGLTRDADGTITYNFDGHVKARGLDLLAGTFAAPPDDRKIRWLRESTGALVAEIEAHETFNQDVVAIRTVGSTRDSAAQLEAHKLPDNRAEISAIASQLGRNIVQAKATDADGSSGGANGGLVRIIDDLGQSSFLRLAVGPLNRRIHFGAGTLIWDGSTASNPLTIFHGLNVTPIAVLATSGAILSHVAVQAQNVGPTSFDLVGTAGGAINTQSTVYWLAIG